MIKRAALLLIVVFAITGFFIYRNIFVKNLAPETIAAQNIKIVVEQGMTFPKLLEELTTLGFKTPLGFGWYAKHTGFDRNLQPGNFEIKAPITVAELIKVLSEKIKTEESITILPGWDLRDLAKYFVDKGIAKSDAEVYALLGKPAAYEIPGISPEKISWLGSKPSRVSLEGYLAPDTYSIYTSATLDEVVDKLLEHRKKQLEPFMPDIKKSGRSLHEIMTMASLLEREVRSPKDKAIVADIFWKRHDVDMGLQADSTVHYATAKEGSVFTSNADRASDNPWNTYKYPGLPPGPIAFPSVASIEAAIHPTKNDYWYFLTTLDTGEVKYASTLAGHNANVQKYLR